MITNVPHINLRPYNTFRIDSFCDNLIEFTSTTDIPHVIDMIGNNPWIMIGQGSNILFCGDYHGSVLHSRILDITTESISAGKVLIRVGSGVNMDQLIEYFVNSGLWGAENLSGIPGEVGASAVQNVGAYGVEACDFIKQVECYDTVERRFITLTAERCNYGYRDSLFKHEKNRYVISYVTMELSSTPNPKLDYGSLRNEVKDPTNLQNIRNTIITTRNAKLPSIDEFGSAGSYFKNPIVSDKVLEAISSMYPNEHTPHFKVDNGYKLSAAWLIDKCGMKGYTTDHVEVWRKQPLVIVNKSGKATSDQVIELEQLVIEKVKNKFDILLSPEVEHIFS